ncbi:Fur family transcriptional regulator [Sphingomonas montana]|uniref:Fur family transcriptional regulator n=1 Tax=Sphingomonas montana TaxID=1843236 RepID=UPI00096F61F7|nr:Fur family transcriptional regulator [Sphingomonas montana]
MTGTDHAGSKSLIRAAGLRVTRQRVAVFDAVDRAPHMSAAAVLGSVTAVLPSVSHQAIYDCLAHLTDAGLLRRMAVDGGPAVYETRTHDNHHHCICRGCGLVVDVDCAVGSAPCLDVADAAGFVIDEAEITYRGLCPACLAARGTATLVPNDNIPQENDIGRS